MKIGVLGGSGFIGRAVVKNLLENNFEVVNVDLNEFPELEYSNSHNFNGYIGDLKDDYWFSSVADCDVLINFAAALGGIEFFHKYPATLMLENERICASVFEVARDLYQNGKLKKIIQLSSSMVFESTEMYPSIENDIEIIPPPKSVYGFQKLASEYWCQAYNEQYGLPYVIVRPFNAIGIGEDPLKDSHVIPQLIYKVLQGQNPLKILGQGNQIRQYTHVSDIAEAIRLIILTNIVNTHTSFNVVNKNNQINVLQLAEKIWYKINPGIPFKCEFSQRLKYDVQKRIGSSEKIFEELGWVPQVDLDSALDGIIADMNK